MSTLFNLQTCISIVTKYSQYYIRGVEYTLLLSLAAILLGLVLGMILTAGRMCRILPIRLAAVAYLELIRDTPMMVQLLIIYYGIAALLPLPKGTILGFVKLDMFIPGAIAVAMNSAAYLSEVMRSGIQAVDGGQTEAARSLGMTQLQCMQYIVLPQAVKNILPALVNEFVTLIKESSVCMVIGVPELMYNMNIVKSKSYKVLECMIPAALMYFCIAFPLSKLIGFIERRMRRGDVR